MKRNRLKRFRLLRYADSIIRLMIYKTKYGTWPVDEITCEELNEKLQAGETPILIDVRMKSYFNTRYGHIKSAISYPSLKMLKKIDEIYELYNDKEVITMCYGGGLSLMSGDLLLKAGLSNVKSLLDGTDKWNELGFPTVFDKEEQNH